MPFSSLPCFDSFFGNSFLLIWEHPKYLTQMPPRLLWVFLEHGSKAVSFDLPVVHSTYSTILCSVHSLSVCIMPQTSCFSDIILFLWQNLVSVLESAKDTWILSQNYLLFVCPFTNDFKGKVFCVWKGSFHYLGL